MATTTSRYSGFTIVELLIVVVVIAILAAVTIVAYNGVANRAIESSMRSDLRTSAVQVENEKTLSGGYPLTASVINGSQGLRASGDNILSYVPKAYGFCVEVSNPRYPDRLRYRSNNTQVDTGRCEAIVSTVSATSSSPPLGLGYGIAIDPAGNYIVSSSSSSPRVHKITSNGATMTALVTGTASFDGNNTLRGVAVGTDGSMYVVENSGNRIYKISSSNVVSVFAGSGVKGSADGLGTAAQFNQPFGMAIDNAGNLYVSEEGSGGIRKISPSGNVSTLVSFTSIYRGIAVDGSGNVYVGRGNSVVKFSSAGTQLDSWSIAGIPGGAGVPGIALDSQGNIYVTAGYGVVKLSPSGVQTVLAGTGTSGYVNGLASEAQFSLLRSIVIDSAGNIYVGDGNDRIRKIEQ